MRLTYRPRARRAVAGASALLWGFFFYGLIDLLVRFVPIDDFYDTYLLETGWGVLYFILVTVPLLSVVFVPALVSPVTQVALAGCAVAVAALLTHTWMQLLPAGALVLIAAVLYLLGTPETDTSAVPASGTVRRPARIDVPTLLLTAAAALPLMWFAAEMVRSAGAGLYPNDDITAGFNHWPMQAALPLTVLATAGLSAFRQVGWQVSAWTVAAGTGWMGVFSVAYPHHAGSFGLVGGAAAIVWSVLLAASTLRSSPHAQTSHV